MCLSLLLNIILILSTAEKTSKVSYCSRFEIFVWKICNVSIFKNIIRLIIYFAIKNVSFPQSKNISTVKDVFHSEGTFPQSRNFSTVKEHFHIHGFFLQSRNFSTVKELFNNQGNFPQKKFTWSKKFSTNNEVFYSQGNFPKINFILSSRFSTNKEVFHKNFYTVKKFFCKQRSKRFSKS